MNISHTPSFQVNNLYISIGFRTHLRKRLSIMRSPGTKKYHLALLMLAPPKNKAQEGGVQSEMFGYLQILDRRYYRSSDFLLNFSKVFVLLKSPEFRNFLIVLCIHSWDSFFFLLNDKLNLTKNSFQLVKLRFFKADLWFTRSSVPDGRTWRTWHFLWLWSWSAPLPKPEKSALGTRLDIFYQTTHSFWLEMCHKPIFCPDVAQKCKTCSRLPELQKFFL